MSSLDSSFDSFWHETRDEELWKHRLKGLSCSLDATPGHTSTFFAFTKVKENYVELNKQFTLLNHYCILVFCLL